MKRPFFAVAVAFTIAFAIIGGGVASAQATVAGLNDFVSRLPTSTAVAQVPTAATALSAVGEIDRSHDRHGCDRPELASRPEARACSDAIALAPRGVSGRAEGLAAYRAEQTALRGGPIDPRVGRIAAQAGETFPVRPDIANLSPKIQRQMANRGWTADQISEAFAGGREFAAVDKLRGGIEATRYVHATSGQSAVIDDVTGEVIHVGGPGFRY